MRSVNKSDTIPLVLTDADGNKHDAIMAVSIVTRETAFDLRATLTYPYETLAGAQADAIVRRANARLEHSMSYIGGNYAMRLTSFLDAAKFLPLVAGYPMPITGIALWAEVTADFAKMFNDIVTLAQSNANLRDPDTAYVVANRPSLSGAPNT